MKEINENIKKGQTVRQGDNLGTVGSTGYSTGPHLHFAVCKEIDCIDFDKYYATPVDYINTNPSEISYKNYQYCTVTTGKAEISSDNVSATLRGALSVANGSSASECGMYIGTSANNPTTKLGSDSIRGSITFFYNTQDCNYTLQAGKTYYYQAYAIVNEKEYKGEIESFKISGGESSPKPSVSCSVTTDSRISMREGYTILYGSFAAGGNYKASKFGMLLGTTEGNVTDEYITGTNMSYTNFGQTIGFLAPGTYYYRTYAVVEGELFSGKIRSFTREVNVTLDANYSDGTCQNKTITSGSTYGTLPVPTRKGYVFEGWYTEKGEKVTADTRLKRYAVTLYAHWEKTVSTCTVTFDANGGNVSRNSKNVSYGEKYGTLPTPERKGCKFTGWYTADGKRITASSTVKTAETHTLYAHWTANTYKVTFNANGGNVSRKSKNVTYGEKYGTLPTPEKNGYTFTGWYTQNGEKITASTKVLLTGAQTLYARWSATTCKVTFNANGGSGSGGSKSVVYGEKYGTLPTSERKGYKFAGWYTEDGTGVTASTMVRTAKAHTLYAHWTANTYKVVFDANGGNMSKKSKNVTYGEKYGTLPTPERKGYMFTGWYTQNGGKVTASTTVAVAGTQTLCAHWKVKTYTVNFDMNGGKGYAPSKTVTYGGTYGELPTPSSPSGQSFAGWYTTRYGGSRVWPDTEVTITESQMLYAHWEKKAIYYTIDIDYNYKGGGGYCVRVQKGTSYSSVFPKEDPKRSGYDFVGWYTASSGGSAVSRYASVTSSDTLYAHWTKSAATKTYYVTRAGNENRLVINSVPRAGNKISNIPAGAEVKVYPDKASGNWYYVEYNGVKGYSSKNYLTTARPAMRLGEVTGTNGQYLAINAQANTKQRVGRIPPGGLVIVYTNLGTGRWYWVNYNGIWGFASRNYIRVL